MNNWLKFAVVCSATLSSMAVLAQEKPAPPPPAQQSEDIVIRKKGSATEKTTIVIDGDKVTINGKPADEYKGDVSITKARTLKRAPTARVITRGPDGVTINGFGQTTGTGNKALLGVTTEKADGGVKVTSVTEESGAAKAGLKENDVITKIGSKTIASPSDLVDAINGYKPNDKVDVTYKRDGKENKATATLGENKLRSFAFNLDDHNFNFQSPRAFAPSLDGQLFSWSRRPKIGMQIQDLEEGDGVKVSDIDDESPASKSGFKEGDVITAIDGKPVAGVDELKEAIKDKKEGDSFKVDFKRDGKMQSAEIKLPKKIKTADL